MGCRKMSEKSYKHVVDFTFQQWILLCFLFWAVTSSVNKSITLQRTVLCRKKEKTFTRGKTVGGRGVSFWATTAREKPSLGIYTVKPIVKPHPADRDLVGELRWNEQRGTERPSQRNLEKDRVQKGSQRSDRNRPLPSASKNLRLCRYHQVTYIAVGIMDLHTHGWQLPPAFHPEWSDCRSSPAWSRFIRAKITINEKTP